MDTLKTMTETTSKVIDLDLKDVLIETEPFPDVAEELSKYTEDKKKNWNLYFKMMNALHQGRQYRTRTNSWGLPDKRRPDHSPYTKSPRAARIKASHQKSKAARLARRKNRGH